MFRNDHHYHETKVFSRKSPVIVPGSLLGFPEGCFFSQMVLLMIFLIHAVILFLFFLVNIVQKFMIRSLKKGNLLTQCAEISLIQMQKTYKDA